MNVLVLNCGSSTVKFQIIQTDKDLIEADKDKRLAEGVIERIGSQCLITIKVGGNHKEKKAMPLRDHREAIDFILRWIISQESKIESVNSLADIHAVGHRVVHGGERFRMSARIGKDVLEEIEECVELAPLHNPANLKGIRAAQQLLGEGVPQVAVFDTSFHSTMPETSYLYGIPYQLYRRYKIRRYGFHGTSHRYVAYRYRRMHGLEPKQVNIITLHLGNGASACAIKAGASVNTSMGFTPLEGLIMGTRAGNIDPSIIEFLVHKEGMSLNQVDTLLNKQSGLLGLSGLTSDMRELLAEEAENQDRRSRLAIDLFCARVQLYIGGYLAQMGGADAVIFTGGIGSNSAPVRERICAPLGCIGLSLDKGKNGAALPDECAHISADDSPLKVFVIPTDEELLIARDTVRVVKNIPRRW
ncbi:MAG: acetate kinase [Elusimicrobiota bacterium]